MCVWGWGVGEGRSGGGAAQEITTASPMPRGAPHPTHLVLAAAAEPPMAEQRIGATRELEVHNVLDRVREVARITLAAPWREGVLVVARLRGARRCAEGAQRSRALRALAHEWRGAAAVLVIWGALAVPQLLPGELAAAEQLLIDDCHVGDVGVVELQLHFRS